MSAVDDCPDREKIAAYLLGDLSDAEGETVARHLTVCQQCDAVADELESASDELSDLLRRSPPSSDHMDEPECQRAVERASSLSPSSPSQSDDRDVVERTVDLKPQLDIGPQTRLGQYELLDRLGRGGMGTVYRALHTSLQRMVALKILAPELMHDANAATRFRREMQAAGQLDHVHIVRATDAGEIGGVYFLAMDFVEGKNLTKLIEAEDTLPVPDACELIRQAALGLDHAHQRGMVHRDVKPSNLMLTTDGVLKVLDFGLARLHDGVAATDVLTTTGTVMGTVAYMSPDQAVNPRDADQRADIYSLGCTLHFLLSGRPPYTADSVVSQLLKHRDDPIPSLMDTRSEIPEALNDVFQKMVAKSPEDRFQSMSEVIAELAPFCEASSNTVSGVPSEASRLARYAQRPSTKHGNSGGEVVADGTIESINDADQEMQDTVSVAIDRRPRAAASRRWFRLISFGIATIGLLVAVVFAANLFLGDREPAGDSGGSASGSSGPVDSTGNDRTVAQWVISMGGTVVVNTDTKNKVECSRPGDLPEEEFHIVELTVTATPQAKPQDFAQLSNLRQCGTLRIDGIDDECLKQIRGLSLRDVFVERGKFGNEGFEQFAAHNDLTKLIQLSLDDSIEVTDVALTRLAFPHLDRLNLSNLPVGDSVLTDLSKRMPDIQLLRLTGTQVTEVGLRHLSKLDLLYELDICRISVTADEVSQLKAMLPPACIVRYDGNPEGSLAGKPTISVRCKLRETLDMGGPARAVTFSPGDGTFLAASRDGALIVWDLKDIANPRVFETTGGRGIARWTMQFSPCADFLAVGTGDHVFVIDPTTGEYVARELGKETVAWSPDGSLLAVGSYEDHFKVLDAKNWEPRFVLPHDKVFQFAFSADGQRLVSGDVHGNLNCWSTADGEFLWAIPGAVPFALSSNGLIATNHRWGAIVFWDLESQRRLYFAHPAPSVLRLAFSPDGRVLAASYSYLGAVDLFDARTGLRIEQLNHPMKRVSDVAFSPDGLTLATAGEDGMIRLFDIEVHPEK